jgi:hypothetical protein
MPSETAAGYIKQPFVHRSIRPAVLFVVVMLMAIKFSPVRLRQHTGFVFLSPDERVDGMRFRTLHGAVLGAYLEGLCNSRLCRPRLRPLR